MSPTMEQLLSDFIDAWNAGARPDVSAYLAQAPDDDRDELATQIEMWLEIAPVPDYDDAALAAISADPILVAALAAGAETIAPWPTRLQRVRERAGLKIEQVAERLTATMKLSSEPTVAAAYLARAEHAELDERRVSRRLVSALASVLGADADELRPAWGPLRPAAALQHFRIEPNAEHGVADLGADFDLLSRAAAMPAPAPSADDEIDRLFTGGPDA